MSISSWISISTIFHPQSMRPTCLCLPIRPTSHLRPLTTWRSPRHHQHPPHRSLLTLAIETSCDDTSVAILETTSDPHHHLLPRSTLHYHTRLTSNNLKYQGIHPIIAHESHQQTLSTLINDSLRHLPIQRSAISHVGNSILVTDGGRTEARKKPDFVTVTRGPGMRANLATGLDTAKGLATAWQIPLLAVNHMQAHALTPRLVSSLNAAKDTDIQDTTSNTQKELTPTFPFLSLLLSGGHTLLLYSKSLTSHAQLATTTDLALGDYIDKSARAILPSSFLLNNNDKSNSNTTSTTVSYGPHLETFAFPNGASDYNYTPPPTLKALLTTKSTPHDWSLAPPLSSKDSPRTKHKVESMEFTLSGLGSTIRRLTTRNPDMALEERRLLARETMRVAFEHVASRLLLFLTNPVSSRVPPQVKTLVLSGGVASNLYLRHVLRAVLDSHGFGDVELCVPPVELCTDNAAMIAWTGCEMWREGWRSGLDVLPLRRWGLDDGDGDGDGEGGILGVEGWVRVDEEKR